MPQTHNRVLDLLRLLLKEPATVFVVGTGSQARQMRRHLQLRARIATKEVEGCSSMLAPTNGKAYIVCATPRDAAVATLRARGIPQGAIFAWEDLKRDLEGISPPASRSLFGLAPLEENDLDAFSASDVRLAGVIGSIANYLQNACALLAHQSSAELETFSVVASSYLALRRELALRRGTPERRLLVPIATGSDSRDVLRTLARHSRIYLRPNDSDFENSCFKLLSFRQKNRIPDLVPAAVLGVILDRFDCVADESLCFLLPYLDKLPWFECHLLRIRRHVDREGDVNLFSALCYTCADRLPDRISVPQGGDMESPSWNDWAHNRKVAWYLKEAENHVAIGSAFCAQIVDSTVESLDLGLDRALDGLSWPKTTALLRQSGLREGLRSEARARFSKPTSVIVWGIGSSANRLLPLLTKAGIRVDAFVDPDTTTLTTKEQRPVLSPTQLAICIEQYEHVPVVIAAGEEPDTGQFHRTLASLLGNPRFDRVKILHPAFVVRFAQLSLRRCFFHPGYPSTGNTLLSAIIGWLCDYLPADEPDEIFARRLVTHHAEFLRQLFREHTLLDEIEFDQYRSLFQVQIEKISGNRRIVLNNIPLVYPLLWDVSGGHFCPNDEELEWMRRNGVRVFFPIRHPMEAIVSMAQKVFYAGSRTSFVPSNEQLPAFRAALARIRLDDPAWLAREADELKRLFLGCLSIKEAFSIRFERMLSDPIASILEVARWMNVSIPPEDAEAFWRAKGLRPINRSGYDVHYNNPTVLKYPSTLTPNAWRLLEGHGYRELLDELGYDCVQQVVQPVDRSSMNAEWSRARDFFDWEQNQNALRSALGVHNAFDVEITGNDAAAFTHTNAFVSTRDVARILGLITV